MKTAAVAAVCDRRSLFFKCFGAPRPAGAGSERRTNSKTEVVTQTLRFFGSLLKNAPTLSF